MLTSKNEKCFGTVVASFSCARFEGNKRLKYAQN